MKKLVLLSVLIGAVLCSSTAFCLCVPLDEPTKIIHRIFYKNMDLFRDTTFLYEYEHDANGNLTTRTTYEEQFRGPVLFVRTTYEYNDDNTVLGYQDENVLDGVLTVISNTRKTYDENGNNILDESERLVDGEMRPYQRTEMLYENNNIVESRYYNFQEDTSNFELDIDLIFTYNDDDLIETKTQTPYGDSRSVFLRSVYQYDEDQNMSYREVYSKTASDQEWDLIQKEQYSYNEFGICEETLDNLAYTATSKYIYVYDNNGRLIEKMQYNWDSEEDDWFHQGSTIYSYDDQSASVEAETAPEPLILTRNFPNPFNPVTTIEYTLPDDLRGTVTLAVYDARGALVRTLVQEEARPGVHSAVWDGADRQGVRVSNGVYFCRLQAGSTVQSHKMLLLK